MIRVAWSLLRYRQLIWEMARRDLTEVHAGQFLGRAWSIIHPLIYIGVFLFLFSVIFKMKISGHADAGYPLYLLSGLIPWLMTQEVLTKSAALMPGNAALVKKVAFPLEVLPAKTVVASLITECLLLTALIAYAAFIVGELHWTMLLLPILVMCQIIGMIGLAMLLSVLAAYFRDLSELIRVFALVNIYLMPVVYLPDWAPPEIRPLLSFNPFSHQIWCFQDVLFFGHFAHTTSWIVFPILCLLAFVAGHYVFERLKGHLGSVL